MRTQVLHVRAGLEVDSVMKLLYPYIGNMPE